MRTLIASAFSAAALLLATPAMAVDTYPLTYTAPEHAVTPGQPSIAPNVEVIDARENDPDWFGAIRGGYGNPLKVLRTEQPIAVAVSQVFRQGLEARNLAGATDARHVLSVQLTRFDSSQYARREAHVVMTVTLKDAATGAALHQQTVTLDRVNGSILSLRTGIFASPEELRALANQTLVEGIDQALDEPAFRAALAAAPASSAPVAEKLPAPVAEPPPPPAEAPPPPTTTP
ncbi:MAG: hypothetical protein WDM79_00385 [Terricaulis sp.]